MYLYCIKPLAHVQSSLKVTMPDIQRKSISFIDLLRFFLQTKGKDYFSSSHIRRLGFTKAVPKIQLQIKKKKLSHQFMKKITINFHNSIDTVSFIFGL